MHRIVFAAVLCAAITFGAQAKFAIFEEGHFTGSEYLDTLYSDDLRFAYIAGLVDGQRSGVEQERGKNGQGVWLALCIAGKGLGTLRPAFEQDLKNHAEKMLLPVNKSFFGFVEEHAC
jgi:hypothetical protein